MTDNTDSMAGQTVLITGGTGGIGKTTAIGVARLGARVGITGRDRARAEAAAADIDSRPLGAPAPARLEGWRVTLD
jgi:NAD(P)-dependent dehydrogenase (short-subunit alcohol dehydrogenase family)